VQKGGGEKSQPLKCQFALSDFLSLCLDEAISDESRRRMRQNKKCALRGSRVQISARPALFSTSNGE
jgi:hypothetical protein